MKNEKENIKKELLEIAPKLGEMQKPGVIPFSVPDNYFEEFPFHVKDKIDSQKAVRGVKLADLQKYLLPRFAPALAAFALLLIVSFFFLWNNTGQVATTQTIAVDTTNEFYIDNLDEDLLVETLVSEDISATEKLEEKSVKTDVLENFIIENYEATILEEEL